MKSYTFVIYKTQNNTIMTIHLIAFASILHKQALVA